MYYVSSKDYKRFVMIIKSKHPMTTVPQHEVLESCKGKTRNVY